LNVKHGASHLYLGGGSNYLAPALIIFVNTSIRLVKIELIFVYCTL